MNGLGYLAVFGSLAVIVSLIVCGAWLHNGYGVVMIVAGAVAAVAWLVAAFQLASAMNSDI